MNQLISQGLFDAAGIQQTECDIQRFAETAVRVVVDFSCVHDDADAQLPLQSNGMREVGVVVG